MAAPSRKPGGMSATSSDSEAAGFANAHAMRRVAPQPSAAIEVMREGLALFAVGELRKAEQAFRAVIEVAPDQPLAWNNLALVLVSLDEPEEAAQALQRSLALDGAQLASWTSLASVLLRLGQAQDADAACAAALALDPACAEAWQTRAFAQVQAENFAAAAEAFSRALDLTGESAALYLNLGATLLKCGRLEDAATALARVLTLDPDSVVGADFKQISDLTMAAIHGDRAGIADGGAADPDRLLKTVFLLLGAADRREAAALVAEVWVAASPDNIEAAHLRDAALARDVDRQSAALVAQQFDGIADDFNDRLVRRLGYSGPERLQDLLAGEIAPQGALDILDLGCGTGLCAPMLRPYARRLAGIDLSARMLAKAEMLGLYDSLEVADLLTSLDGPAAAWDLLIAADTFPYLGDLEAVFAGAAASLRPGGWFAFSTETTDTESFVLKTNGRYAQGPRYIERLAVNRFAIIGHAAAPLRREGGQTVMGDFFLLSRSA